MTSLHPARYPRPAARPGQPAGWPPAGPGATHPARQAPVPPAWGWKIPGAGRAAHVAAAPEYQATTTQVCGLFPFTAGSGTPAIGTPVGRHQLFGEVVCLDPLAWLRAGLVVNPGEFVLGQPGVGKSTLVKRQLTGAVATGTRVLVLGDTKPDYSMLVEHLGGQVIRVGRGLDRINPLDAGPLGAALRQMSGPDAQALRWEVRSRRLSLLMALCTLIRGAPITNAEEVILGRAIDLLDDRLTSAQPAVTDVLAVIEQGPDTLRAAARTDTPAGFRDRVADLVFTLDLLCTGSLAGVFDQQTSRPVDLDAPAVSVDISRVGAAGDHLLTAAMLCTWAHGYAMVDAAAALAEQHLAPRRSYLAVMDELWRALRGAPGLVEYADSLTRLNRAKGMGTIMITHSLADLDALVERGRPRQGPRLRRTVRHHRHGRPAAPRTRAGLRDHPAHRPGTGTGHLMVGTRLLAARRQAPRPRKIPHQDGRKARNPGRAVPGRRRIRPLRHRPGHPRRRLR